MATSSKLSSFVFLFVLLADSLALRSSTEPTISASPKPYVVAPAPPEEEASLPPLAPSSSEFVGKKSSSSSRLDYAAAIVGILLFSFLISIAYLFEHLPITIDDIFL
ncbi:hypothetical protein D0Y65_003160 [Glycine soja]|uniref:Transmembrane protein n=2 Tax=Glycine subgen. Soja TaxID=1462606 RepID=K7K6T2_SOYBN|nr:hypothetical protein D0Y65_003160 [Glycine soja]